MPPRFLPLRCGRGRSSRVALPFSFSCSSSVSSDSSEPLSRPAPPPLWLEADVCVSGGGGDGDGDGELSESSDIVELGIAYDGEDDEGQLKGEKEPLAPNSLVRPICGAAGSRPRGNRPSPDVNYVIRSRKSSLGRMQASHPQEFRVRTVCSLDTVP